MPWSVGSASLDLVEGSELVTLGSGQLRNG